MTTPSLEKTTRRLSTGAREAGRTTAALLRDSGFATIGATDAAVAYVRKLGERAEQLRVDLPDLTVLRDRGELTASLRELGSSVEERFEALAGRGREVVESLQRNRPTREAAERASVARSQVKAATTSVAKAGEAAGEALQESAASVGDDAAVDYETLTVEQLRELARERGITGRSDMTKAQLVSALRRA